MTRSTRPGTLYLIPTNLGEPIQTHAILPAGVIEAVSHLEYFIVENAKTARKFLKAVGIKIPLQSLDMRELNEHTPTSELPGLLQPVLHGIDAGLLSEAGAPAVADPGAALVALAHAAGVAVAPLVGPSSLLLALMASGLNGQSFAFHGYLPADREGRIIVIADLERESARRSMTQMCIETPYRNNALLADLLDTCSSETRICIATNLTASDQSIVTRRVAEWRKAIPDINRKPTVFLMLAAGMPARKKRD